MTTELYARKQWLSSLEKSVEAFFIIGAKAFQVNEVVGNSGSLTPFLVVQKLKKIEVNIGTDNFEKLFANSKMYISRESELEQYLDKFKAYYHKTPYFVPLANEQT